MFLGQSKSIKPHTSIESNNNNNKRDGIKCKENMNVEIELIYIHTQHNNNILKSANLIIIFKQ